MEWKRGPIVGRGSSASVSLATTAAGDFFAVKSATAASSGKLLQDEQAMMAQLNSPFVVKCLGSGITVEEGSEVFNLFLEYVPGGTLSYLIRSRGGSLDEAAVRFYAHQLVQGLDYLHRRGIAHCDIKGQNVLIGHEGLKIADFGCARWAGQEGNRNFAGTPAYMAPEVARGEEQGCAADIWALGCTVIEMATGSNPWPQMKDPAAALYRVAYSGDVPEFPAWFSDGAKDFLGKCLARNAAERWTAADLLEHPFISSICRAEGKSPTSVMDQYFWDVLNGSDSSPRNPTDTASSSSDSPAGRITGLAAGDASNFRNWTEEEDWFTVRVGVSEEHSSRIHYNSENSSIDEQHYFWVVDEQVIQPLIAIEDSSSNSFSDGISMIDDNSFSVGLRGIIEIDSVSSIFEETVKIFRNSDRLFLQSSVNFPLSLSRHSLQIIFFYLLFLEKGMRPAG